MSYRTYVNGVQIFGNNECFAPWMDFIKSQGIKVDADGCYKGEITDVMGAIDAIEQVIFQIEQKRRNLIVQMEKDLKGKLDKVPNGVMPISIFDFRHHYNDIMDAKRDGRYETDYDSLTDKMLDLRENAYIFLSCLFLDACGDLIERTDSRSVPGHFRCYKVKEGCKIPVRAS